MTDDDDELTPPFDHRVPNDTTPWVEVTSIQDDLRPGGGRDLPFRLFATRFKSSSEDSEYFLHDPLRHMLAKPGALNLRDVVGHARVVVGDLERTEAAAADVARVEFVLCAAFAAVQACGSHVRNPSP